MAALLPIGSTSNAISTKPIFDDVTEVKTHPEMAQLGKQFIDRQTAKYDPSDSDELEMQDPPSIAAESFRP
jgi:hypothetical protein